MYKIEIIKKGITSFDTDVIVNAANSHLRAGSGVCGAIFAEAGYRVLVYNIFVNFGRNIRLSQRKCLEKIISNFKQNQALLLNSYIFIRQGLFKE